MTLEDTIVHLDTTLNDRNHDWGCEECKQEHEQLREWLIELKQRRLKESKPRTNGDWLRTLPDEILMKYVDWEMVCFFEPAYQCPEDCLNCVEKWIKQEREEDDKLLS